MTKKKTAKKSKKKPSKKPARKPTEPSRKREPKKSLRKPHKSTKRERNFERELKALQKRAGDAVNYLGWQFPPMDLLFTYDPVEVELIWCSILVKYGRVDSTAQELDKFEELTEQLLMSRRYREDIAEIGTLIPSQRGDVSNPSIARLEKAQAAIMKIRKSLSELVPARGGMKSETTKKKSTGRPKD